MVSNSFRETRSRGRSLILPEGRFLARDLGPGENLELSLHSGLLWVTLEGDPEDHVFHPGSRGTFSGTGKLLLESLEGPVEFTLTEPD